MSLKFEELLPVLNEDTNRQPIVPFSPTTVAATVNDPTKAPGRFPYPLDTVIDDLTEAYLNVWNTKEKLNLATKNVSLPQAQRDRLKILRDKIVLAKGLIKEVATEIDHRFTIDN